MLASTAFGAPACSSGTAENGFLDAAPQPSGASPGAETGGAVEAGSPAIDASAAPRLGDAAQGRDAPALQGDASVLDAATVPNDLDAATVANDAGSADSGFAAAGDAANVDAGASAACGATPNPVPFGCHFAFGVNGVSPTTYSAVQFISNWAGYAIKADGTFGSCDQCGWLKNTMGSAPQVPALIAYFIGYYGHANGLPDGNQNPNGPNLTNGMGKLLLGVANAACPQGVICENNLLVKAYAWYAAQVYAVYKKPVVWMLEGDFVQYSPEGSQTVPISWDQTGQLAGQITRAIKCNDPSAVLAWNYSTWISTGQRDSYFNTINANVAKLGTSYEMVFTTGQGNTTSAGTGTTWQQLYTVAGNKPILVDESFGLSAAGDTWANQSPATINARIAGHVAAVDITTNPPPSYLQANLTSTLLPSSLNTTCF